MLSQLFGDLMDAGVVRQWLRQSIARASDVSICSAFIRSDALLRLLESAPPGLSGKVLVRWQIGDLLAGASDLEVFDICQSRQLKLFMRQGFHGKVYGVPPFGVIVGSSNATLSGLGMAAKSNTEASTLVECKPNNLAIVETFFDGATEVTEEIIVEMRQALTMVSDSNAVPAEWPDSVLKLLCPLPNVVRLLVSECLWSIADGFGIDVGNVHFDHDLSLLGLRRNDDLLTVRAALRKCNAYLWLINILRSEPSHELYFGRLSALLHDSLLDDPTPTRRDIKDLLACLLSWIQKFAGNELTVDRPNYSQRVRLNRPTE